MAAIQLRKRFYCHGVFQGGGCKAVAYVGAYQIAYDEFDIRFSRVAGTSAGSIIAALIGAGATPAQLKDSFLRLNFEHFIEKRPKGVTTWPAEKSGWLRAIAKPFKWPFQKIGSRIVMRQLPPHVKQYAKTTGQSRTLESVLDFANRFIGAYGYYSIDPVRDWIDAELEKLIGHRQAKFGSLKIPTYVVSADLDVAELKVWGQPNEVVSDAVAASCAIPFFFQPLASGDNKYGNVDGGILSNLPLSVFCLDEENPFDPRQPIIAFGFESPSTLHRDKTPDGFAEALATSITEGAAKLQRKLQHKIGASLGQNTCEVRISAKVSVVKDNELEMGEQKSEINISATDFELLAKNPKIRDALIVNGIDASREVLKSLERSQLRAGIPFASSCLEIADRDQLYGFVVAQRYSGADRIVIREPNGRWVWRILPSIVAWLLDGKKIDVIVSAPAEGVKEKEKERFRAQISLLKRLGVHCVLDNKNELSELPDILYMFHSKELRLACIADIDVKDGGEAVHGYVYEQHESIFQFLESSIDKWMVKQQIHSMNVGSDTVIKNASATRANIQMLKLNNTEENDLLARIRGCQSYKGKKNVEIVLEELPVDKLNLITHTVQSHKLFQADTLYDLYTSADIHPFSAIQLFNSEKRISYGSPPVVEENTSYPGKEDTGLVVVDGCARVLYSYRNEIPKLPCIVVRNVSGADFPLPGVPINVSKVRVVNREQSMGQRVQNYNYRHMRWIDDAVRPLEEMEE